MKELSKYYTYDVNKVVEEIRKNNSKRVLIQLPDGLKHFSTTLIDELRSTLRDVEFVVDAAPIYGSCILNNNINKHYDLTLHFGHEPYPYTTKTSSKVLTLDFLSTLTPNNELLNKLVELMKTSNIQTTAIYTVHQHKNAVEHVIKHLESKDIKVLNKGNNATIMGCWFNDALKHLSSTDSYTIIASGLFHPLGIGLLTKGTKHIIQLDLHRNEVRKLNDTVEKYLRIRYSKIMNSMDARNWSLIHGVEGQYRSAVREELVKVLKAKGINFYEYQSTTINQETLRNIDSTDVDVYVITACPRIPIDDLQDFEKPVLTPGEALMVLKGVKEYIFPW